MNNPIPSITDEVGEQLKDFGRIAKKQITSNVSNETKDPKKDKKVDPVTGKKPPTKQQLSTLQQQTVQLAQARLKKVREELEKQRLKISGQQTAVSSQQAGPVIREKEKKQDDAVAKTLKASKSTGEFKGLIGG